MNRDLLPSEINRMKRRLLALPRSLTDLRYQRSGHGLLITSIPKAGTHLISRLAKMLHFSRPLDTKGLYQYYGWESAGGQDDMPDILAAIERLKPRRHLVSHLIYDARLAGAAAQAGARTLLMYRDPRAVVWSHINHVFKRPASKYHAFYTETLRTKEACIEVVIRGIAAYPQYDFPGEWLEDIRTVTDRFLPWLNDERCLGVRFEDLIGARGGGSETAQRDCVRAILDHLRYPCTEASLVSLCEGLYSEASPTFSQGRIDSWRDAFTPKHHQMFATVAGDLLARMGYPVHPGGPSGG